MLEGTPGQTKVSRYFYLTISVNDASYCDIEGGNNGMTMTRMIMSRVIIFMLMYVMMGAGVDDILMMIDNDDGDGTDDNNDDNDDWEGEEEEDYVDSDGDLGGGCDNWFW